MAQVGAAILTHHFRTRHEERTILVQFDVFQVYRLVEAGPAGSGVKFGIRGEERLTAGHTLVHSFLVVVVQCAGKGPLRSFHATDLVLLGGQLFFPVRLRLISQIIHMGFFTFLTVLLYWFDGLQKPSQAAREQ